MLSNQICYDGSRAEKLISNADPAFALNIYKKKSIFPVCFMSIYKQNSASLVIFNIDRIEEKIWVNSSKKIWYDNVYVWSIKLAVVTGSKSTYLYTRLTFRIFIATETIGILDAYFSS